MEMQLKQWGARLNELAAKAKTASVDLQAEQLELVRELRTKRDQVQSKLAELKGTGAETWDAIKTGIEGAYSDLEAEFKKLKH